MESILTELTIYRFGIAVFLITSIVTAAISVLKKGRVRKICFLLGFAQLSMLVAYLGMHQEWLTVGTSGGTNSMFQFFGYHITFTIISYLIVILVNASWKVGGALTVALNLFPGATLLSWTLSGAGETVATGLIGLSVVAVVYLLYWPLNAASQDVDPRQRLVYTKIRNFTVLCATSLVVLAVLSAQTLEITTAFAGQLGATYLDIVFVIGITYIALSEQTIY